MDSIQRIEHFRAAMYNLINESNLTIATGYFVLKDIFRDVENIYKEAMTNEIKTGEETDVHEDNVEVEEIEIPVADFASENEEG